MNIADWPVRPFVYRIYDVDGRLIYIGATSNLTQRLVNHRTTVWWWSLAARVEAEPQDDMDTAFVVEHAAIRAEHPAFNLLDRRGRCLRYQHRMTERDVEVCRNWAPGREGYLPMPLRRLIAA